MDVMLLGRMTYARLASRCPSAAGGSVWLAERMNSIPKIVFSRTLDEPLILSNATLAKGNLAAEVLRLKQQPGDEIGIIGSADLACSLANAHLLDGMRLLVQPVILGGAGLNAIFAQYDRTQPRLVDTAVLDGRVVVLEYQFGTDDPI
jgi:dihydrofolate reductase